MKHYTLFILTIAALLLASACKDENSFGDGLYPSLSKNKVLVSSITLNQTSLSLETGYSQTLTATVSPSNASSKEVSWTSSDASIATVDQNGKVTAVTAGSCTITCAATDGSSVKATCSVTVTKTDGNLYNTGQTYTYTGSATSQSLTGSYSSAQWHYVNNNRNTQLTNMTVQLQSSTTGTLTLAPYTDGAVTVNQITIYNLTMTAATDQSYTALSIGDNSTIDGTIVYNGTTYTAANLYIEKAQATSAGLVLSMTLYFQAANTYDYQMAINLTFFGECLQPDNSGIINGYDYVDLGLPSGTLWATCNIGASKPEDYGNYYAWGETSTKSDYSWSNYKWCKGSGETLTKYCNDSSYGYNGFADNLTELETSDDAAYVNWGSQWRMPTYDQFEELINSSYTTTTWTTQNGVYGRKITSRTNGNSIFLPAADRDGTSLYYAGSGYYWSRTLYMSYPNYAWYLVFYSDHVSMAYDNRYGGQNVRPVRFSEVLVTGITLNQTPLSLETGTSQTLTATVSPSYATNKTVKWTSSNESVASVDQNGKVTAVGAGSCTITCAATDGSGVKATCSVTVTKTDNSGTPDNPDGLTGNSIIFSEMGYVNAQDLDEQAITVGDAKLTFSKGSGSTTPKYYTTGTAMRMYGGNTLTITSSKTIAKVEFKYGEDYLGTSYYPTADNSSVTPGSYDYSAHVWTGSAKEIVLTRSTASTGHFRIVSITITFAE